MCFVPAHCFSFSHDAAASWLLRATANAIGECGLARFSQKGKQVAAYFVWHGCTKFRRRFVRFAEATFGCELTAGVVCEVSFANKCLFRSDCTQPSPCVQQASSSAVPDVNDLAHHIIQGKSQMTSATRRLGTLAANKFRTQITGCSE